MKTIHILLALIAATVTGLAQQVVAPATGSAFVSTSVFFIPGITKTNLPTTIVKDMPVGAGGVGFFFRVGATNAGSTTNMTVTLESNIEGSTDGWVDGPSSTLPVLLVPQSGTSPYKYFTNIPPTAPNIGNVRKLRIKSIDNTNQFGVFITNFVWSAR